MDCKHLEGYKTDVYAYRTVWSAAVDLEKEVSESDISSAVSKYVKLRGFFFWRNNSGTMQGGKVKMCSVPGASDWIGQAPDGKFAALELKKKGKEPTEEQYAFLRQVERNGGYAHWADSIDEAIGFITYVFDRG